MKACVWVIIVASPFRCHYIVMLKVLMFSKASTTQFKAVVVLLNNPTPKKFRCEIALGAYRNPVTYGKASKLYGKS